MGQRIAAKRVRLKRAYAAAAPDDGTRVLVDRLWPRGVGKAEAAIDRWIKEIAPSGALRKWYGHDAAHWDMFRDRYRAELRGRTAELNELRALARSGTVTLVYAARDEAHNNAVVLRAALLGR